MSFFFKSLHVFIIFHPFYTFKNERSKVDFFKWRDTQQSVIHLWYAAEL